MSWSQIKTLLSLTALPFLITGVERFLIKPAVSIFPLPDTSIYLFRVGSISLALLAISSYVGNTYGLELTNRHGKPLAIMFVALIAVSYFFLFTLRVTGFFEPLAIIHLINWWVTVFREEFILRGVIQTESSRILKGDFFNISKSIWFTTFIFSIWHLVNLSFWPWQTVALQMLACVPSGIILGRIKEKTGNTVLTYLLHITGDLLFFSLYALVFGNLFFPLF